MKPMYQPPVLETLSVHATHDISVIVDLDLSLGS